MTPAAGLCAGNLAHGVVEGLADNLDVEVNGVGGSSFSGHTGFITKEGNISAHDDGDYQKSGQFEEERAARYRGYTGE
jgi:hypothetical protein